MTGPRPFPFGSHWPLNAVNPDGSAPNVAYSVEFGCYRVNGVLAPNPLSYALPVDTRSGPVHTKSDEDEMTPEPTQRAPGTPPRVNVGTTAEQPPTGSSIGEPASKRRRLNEGDHPMLFQLYRFSNRGEQYLVQLHEPNCGTTRYHHLNVYEEKGKWVMRIVTMTPGNHAVTPLVEDPSPPVFQKRSDLQLQQRLAGWTLENRVRKSDGREDKFYYHQGKQYKSFVQVLTFILYANRDLKDLRLTADNAVVHAEQENADMVDAPEN